jgi:hypothetical protein
VPAVFVDISDDDFLQIIASKLLWGCHRPALVPLGSGQLEAGTARQIEARNALEKGEMQVGSGH